MASLQDRIETLKNLLLHTYNVCHWQLGENLGLQNTNCPNDSFFHLIFSTGPCRAFLAQHYKENSSPVLLFDRFHLAWFADRLDDASPHAGIHLLGPVFTTETTVRTIYRLCSHLQVSPSVKQELPEQLRQIPLISRQQILDCGSMLHYCLTEHPLDISEVRQQDTPDFSLTASDGKDTVWHGTWMMESSLIRCVEEGNLNYQSALSFPSYGGQIGKLSPDGALRQAKNESIVFTTLCTRAAIRGGVSPEGGYNLGDYYIQKAENCQSVADVHNCNREMFDTCIRRVHRAKTASHYSFFIRSALDYIESHIREKILLKDMAKELGYAEYYLTNKFQKETGESINSYIQKRKVETAMHILTVSAVSAAEVSDLLSFSSPSYFSTVFRRHTGVTPKVYQQEHGIIPKEKWNN